MNMKKALLFKLDDFCDANKIEYMVTGTVALAMLGVPSKFIPDDIDIKVFHLKEEQKEKLKELQFLSGLDKEGYQGECYSFTIDGVKVNALVDNTENYDEIISQEVKLCISDEYAERHLIGVQLVSLALKDKMNLKRHKDKTYMLDLIANLSQL